MERPILTRPVAGKYKIEHEFWEDHTGDPEYDWAYQVFGSHHPGVDFYMPESNDVLNAFNGVVVRKEWHKGMGNVVGIRNGNIVAIYAHLSEFKVDLGQFVKTGELVGLSGNTGVATKADIPHLHFELRDITKPELKEMVFKPEFDLPIRQWQEKFTYMINNANTEKTWKFLALRYFGNESKWVEIMKANENLGIVKEDTVLPDGVEVIILNFFEPKCQ